MDAANQRAWSDPAVVAAYAGYGRLFAPEAAWLEVLRPALGGYAMLDLGVGGGRTAVHFAPLVRSYLGIDSAPAMITACRRRLGHTVPGARFEQGDARDLAAVPEASVDFVLFSFNGIDNLPPPDRDRALAEVRRVLRPGGVFAFSTHHLGFAEPYRLHPSLNPLQVAREARRLVQVVRDNRARRAGERDGHAVLPQAVGGWPVAQVHVTHPWQRARLTAAGFREARLASTWDGRGLTDADRPGALAGEPWLNYLCRA